MHISGNFQLHEITRDVVEEVARKKETEGVSLTTVNRMLEMIPAVLRKAYQEWEWLEKIPVIRIDLPGISKPN